jgi:DNA invertase Pin-like site-specific DNA recombinase
MNNVFEFPIDVSHLIKKRVVIYARVSTEFVEQETSYERQVLELAKSVRENKNYNLVCVYADKESGRSTNRPAFSQMMELVSTGAVDLILTKSIARFGRNIVEVVSIIQELRLKGVEVYFEKENISSTDPKMDLTLSLLSAHAEEESNQVSMNTIWAFENKMKKGLSTTTKMYGYSIQGDDWKIIESEAQVVRKLYYEYLNGTSYSRMIQILHDENILSPSGNQKWSKRTIEDILNNEKYCGDMLLRKKMNGRVVRHDNLIALRLNQYLVKNHHEPIISREIYQNVLKLRKERTTYDHKGKKFKLSEYAYYFYSADLKKHFTHVVERHKGKYEVPVLKCKSSLGSMMLGYSKIRLGVILMAQFILDNKSLICEYIENRIIPSTLSLSNQLEVLYEGIDDIAINDQIIRYSKISSLLTRLNRINHVKDFTLKTYSNAKQLVDNASIENIKSVFSKVVITGFNVNLVTSISNDKIDEVPDDRFLVHTFQVPFIHQYKENNLIFNFYIC